MTPQLLVQQEIKKFSVTDGAIEKMSADYMPLSIQSPEDKENYALVQSAIRDVKSKRVSVEHTRRELNEVPLEWQRTVNAEAKRITSLLLPIEEYLKDQKQSIDEAAERAKVEAEKAIEAAYQTRINKVFELGFSFNGEVYALGKITLQTMQIKTMDDDMWSKFMQRAEKDAAEIKAAKEAEEKKQAEESRLLREQKLEQQAKEKELAEREAKIKAQEEEAERLKYEKEREAERVRAEEERQERLAKAKAVLDKQTAERKERLLQLRPERERIQQWIDEQFESIEQMDINSEEALRFFGLAADAFDTFKKTLNQDLKNIYDEQS